MYVNVKSLESCKLYSKYIFTNSDQHFLERRSRFSFFSFFLILIVQSFPHISFCIPSFC
ncbi:hypothetical protein BDZ91DRAFT_739187 [Kalaharituber pfeilii]|nr:hypothetical protein BDZ91DRAFT_739187 [Kalaharituber pfeilii]